MLTPDLLFLTIIINAQFFSSLSFCFSKINIGAVDFFAPDLTERVDWILTVALDPRCEAPSFKHVVAPDVDLMRPAKWGKLVVG